MKSLYEEIFTMTCGIFVLSLIACVAANAIKTSIKNIDETLILLEENEEVLNQYSFGSYDVAKKFFNP